MDDNLSYEQYMIYIYDIQYHRYNIIVQGSSCPTK